MRGWKAKSVNPKTGKRSIVFRRSEGLVDMEVEVPCGKCEGCKITKAREWALRCHHEASMYEDNCFVTLTYNPENLPDDESVSVYELQNFIKRLRKETGNKFRYFACGEYGKEKARPHYHLAIFNWAPPDLYDYRKTPSGNFVARSRILEKVWPKGFISVGELTQASAGYIARYVSKKQTGKEKYYYENEYGQMVEKENEFGIMSRGNSKLKDDQGNRIPQGIGAPWFNKYWKDCIKDFITVDGEKHPVPKYYRNLLLEKQEQIEKRNKAKRKRKLLEEKEKGEMDRRRLDQKETILKSRTKRLLRGAENA